MKPEICLVGQVVVDVLHLKGKIAVRLGGIFHAAKALSALGCDFEIAYVAPAYLDHEIVSYAGELGATKVVKIGNVDGCPNVLLVGEPTEVGSQDYEFLLDQEHRCKLNLKEFENRLREKSFSDVIIFPGGFALNKILQTLKPFSARIHVDANFEPKNFKVFELLGRPLQTLILSTSSDTFLKIFKGDCSRICRAGLKIAHSFLLKENRGGSRYFRRSAINPVLVPAFLRKIIHSVGVGDCYNSIFTYLSHSVSQKASLIYASLIAGEYASSLSQSHFKDAVDRTLRITPDEIAKLQGVSLPWECRRTIHIYIAAPDFKSADVSQIDRVASCLEYHNFVPHRPVRENGEITDKSSIKERSATALADIKLLEQCQILLAILIFDDPGTYIEMGIALQRGIPVIVYAPNRITENLLTRELPILFSTDLDEVISELYNQAAKIHGK